MPRTVTGHVHFNPDRSMRLVLEVPGGQIEAGTTRRSRDLGHMARAAAGEIYGIEPVDIALLVDQPPWLKRGMIVRPASEPDDPGEIPTQPYGQIAGFLPVGGVLVWHPETSAGVYAPEDLIVSDPKSINPAVIEEILQRGGIPLATEQ